MELRSNSKRVPKEPAMTEGGTTTTFAYDAWGQMTSKSQGGYSALYAYGAAHRLYTVTSDFPGEGNVTYITGGDGKRRERTDASGTTQYKWDMGWNVINEENGAGTLQRTYVGHTMAHVDGTDPAYGTWSYYFHDHLGSTRHLRDGSKTSVAAYEFMPYGQVYAASGTATATTHTYAMLAWDDTAGMYFAPFRYYMPGAGRWTQRDPLGMVDGPNVYGYVGGGPVSAADPQGTRVHTPGTFKRTYEYKDRRNLPCSRSACFAIARTLHSLCIGDASAWFSVQRRLMREGYAMALDYIDAKLDVCLGWCDDRYECPSDSHENCVQMCHSLHGKARDVLWVAKKCGDILVYARYGTMVASCYTAWAMMSLHCDRCRLP